MRDGLILGYIIELSPKKEIDELLDRREAKCLH
jgi:hypothetical protein